MGRKHANADHQLYITDDVDEEISIARGIEAALNGLECLDDGMLEGVRILQMLHVERLEAIRARICALEEAAPKQRSAA